MSSSLVMPAGLVSLHGLLRRFSVTEYLRLMEIGIIREPERVELIEGLIVRKMTRNPPHDGTMQILSRRLPPVLPAGWDLRIQLAVTLSQSVPEPDFAVVLGDERTYLTRHPTAVETGLVIEVADSSLPLDRGDKATTYARDSIPTYWIVNLVDEQIEVYTAPSGPGPAPAYGVRQDFHRGATVPLVLAGNVVAQLAVNDLLP